MEKEIEAKFFINNKNLIREKLSSLDFNLDKKEFLMKRKTFNSDAIGKWFRVRDEGNKVTMTFKNIINNTIDGVNEIEVIVNDFEKACCLINQTNFKETSYQENFREIWSNSDVEVVIDTWPFLQPYIEIEGLTEELVKKYSELLGFDFQKEAYFGSVDVLYEKVYNISRKEFCSLNKITFDNTNLKIILEQYRK